MKYNYLIVHCSHHKTGTVWFHSVLREIAKKTNMKYRYCKQSELLGDEDIFHEDHSRIIKDELPEFKGSHIIRDPRAVVVSGYFYHLKSQERWLHVNNKKYGGVSYQKYLNGLTLNDGIKAEIFRCSKANVKDMSAWDYNAPEFIEIKYEDLIKKPEERFVEIFEHYGFSGCDLDISMQVALENTITINPSLLSSKHVTSGCADKWKEFIVDDVKEYFNEVLGDSLIRMGYETKYEW